MRKLSTFLIAGLAGLVLAVSANAAAITWSGDGESGTDPWGHNWTWNNLGGNSAWGIPGKFLGLHEFQGPGWVSDFHITFFGLPDDIGIDADGAGNDNLTFRIFPDDGGELFEWIPHIHDNTVWFVAPDHGFIMNPGDAFFVNIGLTGQLQSFDGLSFNAEWTMDIPEPAGLALLGFGLLGLGAARRRKRAA